MKRFALLLAAPLLAALLAMLTGTGRVAAADPPDPDLTGDWYGNFEPNRDPEARDEAALRVDAQDGSRFQGRLALGRFTVAVEGTLGNPERDSDGNLEYPLLIVSADPPDPDMPVATIKLVGTIRTVGDPSLRCDPFFRCDPFLRDVLTGDYMWTLADGSKQSGFVELVQKVQKN